MHCKVFELNTRKIPAVERMDASELEDRTDLEFISCVADYVEDISDSQRDFEIRDLCLSLDCKAFVKFDLQNEKICFKDGFAQRYFSSALEAFKDRASKITLEEFSGVSGKVQELKNLIEDKYDIYIRFEGDALVCFDKFVREHLDTDTTYYFGGVVDYHY